MLDFYMGVGDPTSNVCMTGTLPTKSSLQTVFCFLFYLCMCILVGIYIPQHVYGGQRATSGIRHYLLLCSRHGIICSYRLHAGWPESIQGFSYLCLLSCSRSTGITHICYPASLFIGSGDLNLGLHDCVTRALSIEISLFCFCFWDTASPYSPS